MINSNHIEGSKLTEDQTRLIFETNTIDVGDGVPVDDILETVHHFRAIDYVIDVAEEELSEEIIKQLHYILKHDTKDSTLNWFAVGDYKRRANMVGGRETVKPKDVASQMQTLLMRYNAQSSVTINDVIALHAEFEYIHPFQDGNGRVGRLIALKECLRHNIIPFIIEDAKKHYYYRGLSEWRNEKGWLTDTCLDGQDTFIRLLDMLASQWCVGFCHHALCFYIAYLDRPFHFFCSSMTLLIAAGSSCIMFSSPRIETRSSFIKTGIFKA